MLDPITAATQTNTATVTNKNILGKDDFLKLMIQQLKNQDPLNPADGTQYAAQLAQFASLEQLTNLNKSIQESVNSNYTLTQSINNTLVATLIGKDVKIGGNALTLSGQQSVTLGYTLPSAAQKVSIKIYDYQGALVRTIDGAPTAVGENKISWDSSDNNGGKLPDGKYTFEVEALNSNGEKIAASLFKEGLIDGVRFGSQGTVLLVNGAEYSISDILEILNSNNGGK